MPTKAKANQRLLHFLVVSEWAQRLTQKLLGPDLKPAAADKMLCSGVWPGLGNSGVTWHRTGFITLWEIHFQIGDPKTQRKVWGSHWRSRMPFFLKTLSQVREPTGSQPLTLTTPQCCTLSFTLFSHTWRPWKHSLMGLWCHSLVVFIFFFMPLPCSEGMLRDSINLFLQPFYQEFSLCLKIINFCFCLFTMLSQ